MSIYGDGGIDDGHIDGSHESSGAIVGYVILALPIVAVLMWVLS